MLDPPTSTIDLLPLDLPLRYLSPRSIMSTATTINPARAAESNLSHILGVTGAVHAVAFIIASLRVYARVGVLKAAGKDDIAIVACIVSST